MMTNLLSSSVARLRFLLVMLVMMFATTEMWGAEVIFNKDGFSNSDKTETKEDITLTFDAVTLNNAQIRFSANDKMVVTSSAGNITRIDVTTNSTETYISPLGHTVSSGSWTKETATKYYWSGDASSVTLTPNASIRITEVKVTYGGNGDDDPNDNSGGTYTIVFASGTNTTATTSSVQLTTMIESGSENVSSFSIDATDTFVYHKGAGTSNNTGSGLRLGKSGGKGKITFNLSNTISTACLSELTISTIAWDASTTITLIINGDKNLTYTTTAGENLTYRPSNPIQLSSITLSADKRAFIKAINITTTQCTAETTYYLLRK